MREFVLAQAQECFWQQAVLQGSYKNGLIGKLSMKVSEYYKSALTSANSTPYPSAGFFPPAWMAHITIKQVHFEAAAQYRLSQEDLEKSRYGEEIARLRVAESLAKKGIDGRKGVAETVVTDLRNLLAAVKSALERAVRDNDLVYVCPIPSTSQLPPIVGVGMVKVLTPPEISDPVTWLMGGGAGMGPLFSGLVPYGVHLAISEPQYCKSYTHVGSSLLGIYDDRKDTLVRELDGKRVELDGVAASTLQSLNLPGSIQALERPVGLPPSLLKKAEEVDSSGGSNKVLGLLSEVNRLSKSNSRILSEAMDILDQEATENETLLARQPHLAPSRPASHIANHHLITTAGQYNSTIKQAAQSDETVRTKWEDWRQLIEILEGGEDTMLDHVPSTSSSGSALPASVRPLRATLEDLDDRIAFRARLLNEAKRISETDDIRPVVLKEASKLAHGGSGDVKTEWFEEIFEQELGKFDRVQNDMEDEISKQEKLLEDIRVANENFLSERKEDPKIKEREKRLQEMDLAYWKWREINDNAEEGIKFYHSFAELLVAFKEACSQFLNSRRGDVGQITNRFDNMSVAGTPPPQLQQQQSYQSQPYQSPSPSPSTPPQLRPAPQGASFLAHPSSSQWQTTSDFLPPPPPPPILRSGGIQTQPRAPPPPLQGQYHENEAEMTPRRSTRNKATPTTIGDSERNPYQKGKRRAGGGVV
ncbi:hypothetical protein P7C73_g49, partial [Tremellales sp. Uapishka_1]